MPLWDYGLVAFLDVLGFSSYVRFDSRSVDPEHLQKLLDALTEVRQSTIGKSVDLRAFSDSVILSAPFSLEGVGHLVSVVIGLQRIFIRRNVLVRGGIAFGKHFADANAIYSEALVTAYELERDHARFPRVLIDPNLFDWFINDNRLGLELRDAVARNLLRDRDGRLFLHYLDAELLPAHESLLRNYEPAQLTASVLEKVQWLAEYHNYTVSGIDGSKSITLAFEAGFQVVQ